MKEPSTPLPVRFRIVLLLLAAAATRLSAQATPPKAAPPRRAVSDTVKIGSYDLEITTDDGTMTGGLLVKRAPTGGYVVEVDAGGRKPAVRSFVRAGPGYILTGGHDTFIVTYNFTFAGDSVSGSFRMNSGPSGTLVGAFKR
jgi:hypothetical protein